MFPADIYDLSCNTNNLYVNFSADQCNHPQLNCDNFIIVSVTDYWKLFIFSVIVIYHVYYKAVFLWFFKTVLKLL